MSQSRQMARLTDEISQASKRRKSAIDAMRGAVKATLATCAHMRGESARDYRARMQEFLASLAKEATAHRQMVAHQIMQMQKFLRAQAQEVAAHRNTAMSQIAHFASSRRTAASHLRRSLQQQVGAIVTQAAALRDAAANAVSELASAQQKMAKQHRAALKSDRRKMHTDVTRFINAMHADRMKAHEKWSSLRQGSAA